jgi:hypothetical protein
MTAGITRADAVMLVAALVEAAGKPDGRPSVGGGPV